MKKIISYCILLILIPDVVVGGALLFRDRQYAWVSLCVTLLSCVPVFLHFERSGADAKRMVLLACMTALSVLGRILFAMIPAFKPVTAMVVITAMYFGSEAGFLTGALSAVISNFYFGQGPWTPFQIQLGDTRLYRRTARGSAEEKQNRADAVCRSLRRPVFLSDGYLDGAVGGRRLQYFALPCGDSVCRTVYGNLRCVQHGLSFAVRTSDREDTGQTQDQIRALM